MVNMTAQIDGNFDHPGLMLPLIFCCVLSFRLAVMMINKVSLGCYYYKTTSSKTTKNKQFKVELFTAFDTLTASLIIS